MYARFFFKSMWLALTHRFDAIHAFRALPEGLVAWAVARLTFRPVVIYAHGEELTGWGQGGKYKVMQFVLRHADAIIANSNNTRKELLRMGVSANRVVLINPGVDVERFHPKLPYSGLREQIGIIPNQKLILSVGRLSRRKGFDKVIQSLPLLRAQGLDVRYALIGIGEDREYLENLALELEVTEFVHLLGHVSPEDLPRWYNACDVFAMPNREISGDNEGFGMVFIEAAACGKPAISGQAGGTGSAVVDSETGLRIDGNSTEAVAGALAAVLRDQALADRFGRAGYERAHRDFSWEAVAARTLQL
jgi:phosphatidylinositol alpha-1,6-mannosyltransferase